MYKKFLITAVFMSLFPLLNAQQSFFDAVYDQLESKSNKDITKAAWVYTDHCKDGADSQECINALNNDDSAFKAADMNEYRVALFLLDNGYSFKAQGREKENFLGMLAFTAKLRPEYADRINALLEKTKSFPEADLADLIIWPDQHKNNPVHLAVAYAPYNKQVKTIRTSNPDNKTFLNKMLSVFYAGGKTKEALCKALTDVNSSGFTPFHMAMSRDNKEAFSQLADAINKAGCGKQQFLDAINISYDKGLSLKDYADKKAGGKQNTGNSFYADVITQTLNNASDVKEEADTQQQLAQGLQNAQEKNGDKAETAVVLAAGTAGISDILPPPFPPIKKLATKPINIMPRINYNPLLPARDKDNDLAQKILEGLTARAAAANKSADATVNKSEAETTTPDVENESVTSENKTVNEQKAPAASNHIVKRGANTAAKKTVSSVNKTAGNTHRSQKPVTAAANKPVVRQSSDAAANKTPAAKAAPQPSKKTYTEKDIAKQARAAANKYSYWQWLESQGGKSAVEKAQRNLAFRAFDKEQRALYDMAKTDRARKKADIYFAQNMQNDILAKNQTNRIIQRPKISISREPAAAAKPAETATNSTSVKTSDEKQPADGPQTAQVKPVTIDFNALAKHSEWNPEINFSSPAAPAQASDKTGKTAQTPKASDGKTVDKPVTPQDTVKVNQFFTSRPEFKPNIGFTSAASSGQPAPRPHANQGTALTAVKTSDNKSQADIAEAAKQAREKEITDSLTNDPKTKLILQRFAEKDKQLQEQAGKTQGGYSKKKGFVGLDQIVGYDNFRILNAKANEIIRVHGYATAPRMRGLPQEEPALHKKWQAKEQRLIDAFQTLAKHMNPDAVGTATDLIRPFVSSSNPSSLNPWDIPVYTDEADSTAVSKNKN